MANFVPLHLSAIDPSPGLLTWIQSWAPSTAISPLSPMEWFSKGHGLAGGTRNQEGIWIPIESLETWHLWVPVPGAGAAVMQELSVSRHKRTHLGHIFVCPCLLTQKWRKRLHCIADIVIELPAGRRPFWPTTMHESLIIGLTLPFSASLPWQLRRAPCLLDLEWSLREV